MFYIVKYNFNFINLWPGHLILLNRTHQNSMCHISMCRISMCRISTCHISISPCQRMWKGLMGEYIFSVPSFPILLQAKTLISSDCNGKLDISVGVVSERSVDIRIFWLTKKAQTLKNYQKSNEVIVIYRRY